MVAFGESSTKLSNYIVLFLKKKREVGSYEFESVECKVYSLSLHQPYVCYITLNDYFYILPTSSSVPISNGS